MKKAIAKETDSGFTLVGNQHIRKKHMKSKEMGLNAENRFVKICKQLGKKCQESSRHENMVEHWDFLVDEVDRIEVKSRKRKNRRDDSVDDSIIFVEFLNVRGNMGWLYGKADFLAFENPEGFIVVSREDLAKLAESLVSSEFASYQTLYKSYRRRSRPDEHVGLIKYSDLLTINHEIWKEK